MSETNQAPDNSALIKVLHEISGKLSILEEINANTNKLERRLEQERTERQNRGGEPSVSEAVDDTARTRSRGKEIEKPVDIDDSDPVSSVKAGVTINLCFAAYFSSDRRLNADFKGYWNRGMGKPNFVGAWERDGATLDYYEFEYEYENKDRRQKMMDVTLVPYSSTPPLDLQDILMSYHFSQKKFPRHLRYGDFFTHAINDILGGIWTLPSDWRVDFDFQHHVWLDDARLPELEDKYFIERARDIRRQHEQIEKFAGVYTVTEINSRGKFFTFNVLSAPSALELEEWCLDIPPNPFWTTPNGFPITWQNGTIRREPLTFQMAWSRVIIIGGCAEVYRDPRWRTAMDSIKTKSWSDFYGVGIWHLHTTCGMKANRSLTKPKVFHITWMRIQGRESKPPLHLKWKREPLYGDTERTIGRVAGSIQYFVGPTTGELEFGTVLVLAPTYYPSLFEAQWNRDNRLNLWIALAANINQLMEEAGEDWKHIATYFKDLLEISNPKNFHIDDKKFSEFLNVLWVIDKLDEILPMVRDSLEQWDWFRTGNPNLCPAVEESPLSAREHIRDVESDKHLLSKHLKSKLQELDKSRYDLENYEEKFKALQTRALSLKDSLLQLKNMNDSILSANIALLTYATIFFLPLTFCTAIAQQSMWVVNNMFGTGGKGFAIITAVIPITTYALVFNLLHPTTKKALINGIKKAATSAQRLWQKLRNSVGF
ncbi:hypothetical protein L207DRAFT_588810 [Hyaloscypha variabilis F]|uniref:Uncharacterized protein n=1 Tax=Hyaloscypha variabilis (strain UAMH 11265 / GT02V1 / F) TaxID=1149755 RepID=A0A2J6R6R8_HYAVF|nr:hypothetical protein L207DRAFT_588810 [Hyaloscypha variabilis F]